MKRKEKDSSSTLVLEGTTDSLDELSAYLEALSSSARLKILRYLERSPHDAREIANEIETSYKNTKKHLDRLLSKGVIKKEAGMSASHPWSAQPTWQYSLAPRGLETIIRNRGIFSNTRVQIVNSEVSRGLASVKKTLSKEVLGGIPAVIVIGGVDDSGSTGGTKVNSHQMDEHAHVQLQDGDIIELGRGSSAAQLLIVI